MDWKKFKAGLSQTFTSPSLVKMHLLIPWIHLSHAIAYWKAWQKHSPCFQHIQTHSSSRSLLPWNLTSILTPAACWPATWEKLAMLLPTSLLLMQGTGGWDDSRRLSTHGYPGMTCALHARWGSTGGYGKCLQTPWSLKRTGSVRNVSTPHASIVDPLTTPPAPAPVYIGEWFLSTKPSLHAPQHTCSGTRGHRLLPHSFLPPIPALQCEQSTRHVSGTGFGCTGCIPAALPARGCTLSVKSINLSAGWKKPCRWVS